MTGDNKLPAVTAMVNGVADVAEDMCDVFMALYERESVEGNLPDLIYADIDAFCAADLSLKVRDSHCHVLPWPLMSVLSSTSLGCKSSVRELVTLGRLPSGCL